MDFYERVKQLVKDKNITLRNLIEGLGMNYDSYNSLKRYGNLPRSDESVKIAQALGVSVEYLVTGEQPQNGAAEKMETVKNLLKEALKAVES